MMKQYSNVLLALFGMFLIGICGWVYEWLAPEDVVFMSGAAFISATVVFLVGVACVVPSLHNTMFGDDQ